MKFWKILSSLIEETLPEWQDKFLSYKDLKKQLKLIYPAQPCPHTHNNKRPRLDQDNNDDQVSKEVIDFLNLLEVEIDKFNAFFVDKEEEYVIRWKVRFSFSLFYFLWIVVNLVFIRIEKSMRFFHDMGNLWIVMIVHGYFPVQNIIKD